MKRRFLGGMELQSAHADFLRVRAIALASIKHNRVMGILAVRKGTVSKREDGRQVKSELIKRLCKKGCISDLSNKGNNAKEE